jgi:perosamine synthetase
MIPYGRQWIDEDDIQSVVGVLRSEWLTTGPKVEEFEQAVVAQTGAKYAVAVSSGTAALHAAMYAIGVGCGDEVIVPAMTFASTANCVVFQGGTPIIVDVKTDTLLINPSDIEKKITQATKAIIAVDYAGHPADYDALRQITDKHGLILVADACHSIGATHKGVQVGTLADLSVFSFHPVKHITTGEGGMVVTDNEEYACRMRMFRNHGITTDHRQRVEQGTWHYEMVELGYNYRISDFQCALGISQLRKLPQWILRRQEIASRYNEAFMNCERVKPLGVRSNVSHAYHLYVIRLAFDLLSIDRSVLFNRLREEGVGVNVHYIPVHLHPYYRQKTGTKPGLCPVAEKVYEEILSLPIFPQMSDADLDTVIDKITSIIDMASLK